MSAATWALGSTRLFWRLVDPASNARGLSAALASIRRHAPLALSMARRELRSRHAGNILGSMWIIGHPLFQMCLFVFIFAVVFQQKIGGNRELPRDYTTYILTGLVPWLAMVPVFTGACSAIIANSNLIKQFSFEAEVLPIKDVALSMVFWVVGVVLIVVYQLFIYVSLPWTLILLPLVLAMHLATMLGVALLLAAITVFVRDVKDIMVLVVSAGVYVLPIVYLPTWVPPIFRPFLYANPFSYLIWVYQDVFYFGRIEHPASWAISAILSLLSLSIGYRVFHRLQPIFGNAL